MESLELFEYSHNGFIPFEASNFIPALNALLDLAPVYKESAQHQVLTTAAIRSALRLLPDLPKNSGYNSSIKYIRRYLVEDLKLDENKDFNHKDIEHILQILENINRSDNIKKVSFADFYWTDKKRLLDDQNWRCKICGVKLNLAPAKTGNLQQPELDHKIPFIFGGNHPDNLQIICKACNIGKGQHLTLYGDIAVCSNMFYTQRADKRLRYWVYIRDGCKCSYCAHTAATETLEMAKKFSRGRIIFDNLITVCMECVETRQILTIPRSGAEEDGE